MQQESMMQAKYSIKQAVEHASEVALQCTHCLLASMPAVRVLPLLPPHPTNLTLHETIPMLTDKASRCSNFAALFAGTACIQLPSKVCLQPCPAWFGQNACKWVSIMLQNLSATAAFNGWRSASFPERSGVQQGSPLSPLLYVLAYATMSAVLHACQQQSHHWNAV